MYTTSSAAMLTVTNRNVFCLRFTASSLEFDRRHTHRWAFADVEGHSYRLCFLMPNLERVFARGDIFNYKLSVLLRFSEVRRFRNDDICRHFRVDIAKHRPH